MFSLKDNAKDCSCRLDHLPEERVDLVFPVSEVAALDKVVRLLAPAAGGSVLRDEISIRSISDILWKGTIKMSFKIAM